MVRTSLWTTVLDILFPPHCALCEREIAMSGRAGALCRMCRKKLERHISETSISSTPGHYLLGAYHGILREAIKKIKYGHRRSLITYLGKLLATKIPQQARWDIIVPMPIRFRSFYRRGFHQTYLLARTLRNTLSCTAPIQHLLHQRHGRKLQTITTPAKRAENISGAFVASPQVRGKRILLVEDVLTTGATIEEATQTLMAAGALNVEYAYLGRAPRWQGIQKKV